VNGQRIAIGAEFLSAYARIPRAQQRKVDEFIRKFRQDPTGSGINFERVNSARDGHIFSVRIDQSYRGIIHKADNGKTFILLWVDRHDDAYEWARRRSVSVNPETGCLQLMDLETAEAPASAEAPAEELRLFRKLKEKHLTQLGVPAACTPAVSAITNLDELEAMRGTLPGDVLECLEMYAAGIDLDDILKDLATAPGKGVDTGDFDAALDKEGSRQFFRVVENEEELEAMLAAPLEKWRVFLHPTQRKLVEGDWNGPVRVLGGAGTGKTVVAMHRARWLAMKRFTSPGDRVLLTTFTKNLSAEISENLRSFTPKDVMERIEVTNLDDWAWSFLKSRGVTYSMALRRETKDLWEKAASSAPGWADGRFLMDELDQVILPMGIDSLEEYHACPREGCAKKLEDGEKAAIWQVFAEYRRLLTGKGLREPADAMRDARKILETTACGLPYKAVVLDEGQDMGMQDFMLVRRIVPPGDDDTNRIFIVGDAHQRIYGRKAILSKAGIEIGDRGRRLKVNYRTTEETRAWADRLLEGLQFDDLDGGVDDWRGYRSLVHGPAPEVRTFDSADEETAFIIGRIVPLLASPGGTSSVCVVARTGAQIDSFESELARRGIVSCRVTGDSRQDHSKPGVRLSTMHRVKGLEFDTIVIMGVNRGIVPHSSAIGGCDEAGRAEALKLERSLLSVAATRARKNVLVTATKPASEFLSS